MIRILISLMIIGVSLVAGYGNNSDRYVVTLEISQVHYTLDIWEHVKDHANKMTMEIPVDKEFYDSVTPGQKLAEEFRTGSLLIRGSFGQWRIKVKDKAIRR